MNLFEKKLKDYLTILKVPINPEDFDPALFYFSEQQNQYVLNPQIATQIAKDLEFITSEQPSRIKDCYLVGDCVVPGKTTKNSKLDVMIVLNKNLMDIDVDGLLAEEILKICSKLSGRLAVGTVHPIHYLVSIRDIDSTSYEGIYDLKKGGWHKLPNGSTNA